MSSFVPHLPLAAAAVLWPFAAGVAVVVWSKAWAAARRRRVEKLETDLRGMFQALEDRPVPPRLDVVLEALDEHAEMDQIVNASARAPTIEGASAAKRP